MVWSPLLSSICLLYQHLYDDHVSVINIMNIASIESHQTKTNQWKLQTFSLFMRDTSYLMCKNLSSPLTPGTSGSPLSTLKVLKSLIAKDPKNITTLRWSQNDLLRPPLKLLSSITCWSEGSSKVIATALIKYTFGLKFLYKVFC